MNSSIITSTSIQLIMLLYFVLLQLKRAGGQSSSTASTSNATISTGRPSSIHKFGTVRLKSPCTNSLTYVPACVLRRKMKCPGWSSSKVTFISWTVRGLTAKGLLLNQAIYSLDNRTVIQMMKYLYLCNTRRGVFCIKTSSVMPLIRIKSSAVRVEPSSVTHKAR